MFKPMFLTHIQTYIYINLYIYIYLLQVRNTVAPTATIAHGDRSLVTFASSIGAGTTSKVKKAHALHFAGVDETLSQLATMSVPSMPQRQVEVKLTKTGTSLMC